MYLETTLSISSPPEKSLKFPFEIFDSISFLCTLSGRGWLRYFSCEINFHFWHIFFRSTSVWPQISRNFLHSLTQQNEVSEKLFILCLKKKNIFLSCEIYVFETRKMSVVIYFLVLFWNLQEEHFLVFKFQNVEKIVLVCVIFVPK